MLERARLTLVPQHAPENMHIQMIKVSKSFFLGGSEIKAVSDAHLYILRNELLVLRGTSGSGKTTLLNMIGCLATPDTGQIVIDGRDVSHMTDSEASLFRARHLGFVFQNFNLLPVLSALENVEYVLQKLPMSKSERRDRALEALGQVGLSGQAAQRPDQLSGGQRQRVAIARAFAHSPKLIIADEPTANLDQKTASEVLDVMSSLIDRTGITVVMASHDPNAIERAHRTYEIAHGRIK